MNLRTARKIANAVGTPRQHRYREDQIRRAADRIERTRDCRENMTYWHALMRFLGPAGRAELMGGWEDTAGALALLLRTPEDSWEGDPTAMKRCHAP